MKEKKVLKRQKSSQSSRQEEAIRRLSQAKKPVVEEQKAKDTFNRTAYQRKNSYKIISTNNQKDKLLAIEPSTKSIPVGRNRDKQNDTMNYD